MKRFKPTPSAPGRHASQRRSLLAAAITLGLAAGPMLWSQTASANDCPPGTTEPRGCGPAGDLAFNTEDMNFILKQIKFAERHAAGEKLIDILPNASIPWGLRTVDGSFNNLIPGNEAFGQADQPFPAAVERFFPDAQNGTSYSSDTSVTDSTPRLISHLIVNQSADNPAAVNAASENVDSSNIGPDIAGADQFMIPNTAPDEGLSAPINAFMTFFGQFFDHGLDLVNKGGNGVIMMPLQSDDPLFGKTPGNVMIMPRATQDPVNATTPHVDQQQTYASHSSAHVLLRHYELRPCSEHTFGCLQSTGRLLNGYGNDRILDNGDDGGMATWDAAQQQALEKFGIELDDLDGKNIPMFAADPYGNFIPGDNGLPQLVTAIAPDGTMTLIEGNLTTPVDATDALRINHSFFLDVAHSAAPNGDPDTDDIVNPRTDLLSGQVTRGIRASSPPGFYDDELLGMHFVCGDGRCNENIALSTIHTIFHAEHNRLNDIAMRVLLDARDLAALNEWLDSPLTTLPIWADLPFPVSDATMSHQAQTRNAIEALNLDWNGERLFQAARFGTEMEYNRIVFDEFAPALAGLKDPFVSFHTDVDPSISLEFSQSVYRFGHSMLTETVDRYDADFMPIAEAGTGDNSQLGLFEAFLNPLALYNAGNDGIATLSPEEATAAVIRGLTRTTANEIDEFVTGALQNNLVGLPLDLGAINIARGRDVGNPSLNAARRKFFAATQDNRLKPYAHWVDYADNLRHEASLVNFIAAYGTHSSIALGETFAGRRAAACAIVGALAPNSAAYCTSLGFDAAATPPDALDFLFSRNGWASVNGLTTTGLDDIDFWNGGLAEERMPFGGYLGSTHNFVFETQLESLQNGDRFYYVGRVATIHLFSELESNSFTALIMRNTTLGEPGAGAMSLNIFSVPNHILEVDQSQQFDATLAGAATDVAAAAALATAEAELAAAALASAAADADVVAALAAADDAANVLAAAQANTNATDVTVIAAQAAATTAQAALDAALVQAALDSQALTGATTALATAQTTLTAALTNEATSAETAMTAQVAALTADNDAATAQATTTAAQAAAIAANNDAATAQTALTAALAASVNANNDAATAQSALDAALANANANPGAGAVVTAMAAVDTAQAAVAAAQIAATDAQIAATDAQNTATDAQSLADQTALPGTVTPDSVTVGGNGRISANVTVSAGSVAVVNGPAGIINCGDQGAGQFRCRARNLNPGDVLIVSAIPGSALLASIDATQAAADDAQIAANVTQQLAQASAQTVTNANAELITAQTALDDAIVVADAQAMAVAQAVTDATTALTAAQTALAAAQAIETASAGAATAAQAAAVDATTALATAQAAATVAQDAAAAAATALATAQAAATAAQDAAAATGTDLATAQSAFDIASADSIAAQIAATAAQTTADGANTALTTAQAAATTTQDAVNAASANSIAALAASATAQAIADDNAQSVIIAGMAVDAAQVALNAGPGDVTADPIGDSPLIALVIRDPTLATININVPDPLCFVQYTGGDHVTIGGTDCDDTLIGGIGDDTLWGRAGNDRLEGGDGADLIEGGPGDDIITDLSGPDVIEGGPGNDAISSGNEEDVVFGDEGSDFIVNSSEFLLGFGGEGNDFIFDGVFLGHIRGGAGNDWMENLGGGEDLWQGDNGAAPEAGEPAIKGHDVAIAHGGNNDFDMENGDDIMVDGPGIERMEGQLGFDWASFQNDSLGVSVDLDLTIFNRPILPPSNATVLNRYDRVEGLSGSPFGDILKGTANAPGTASGNELVNFDLIEGLSDLVPQSERGILPPDPVTGADQFGWTGGEIILGGNGSDMITPKGGNDIIDGDSALTVNLQVGTELFAGMQDLFDDVFSGLLNPGDISISRVISNQDLGAPDTDIVIFSGNRADYVIENDNGIIADVCCDANGNPGPDGFIRVTDNRALVAINEGSNLLRNIERLVFADQTVIMPSGIGTASNNSPAIGLPTIAGTPDLGMTLTASIAGVSDADNVSSTPAGTIDPTIVDWIWESELDPDSGLFEPILRAGANGNGDMDEVHSETLTVTVDEVGLQVRVVAIFQDEAGVFEIVRSNAVSVAIPPGILIPGIPPIAAFNGAPAALVAQDVIVENVSRIGLPRLDFTVPSVPLASFSNALSVFTTPFTADAEIALSNINLSFVNNLGEVTGTFSSEIVAIADLITGVVDQNNVNILFSIRGNDVTPLVNGPTIATLSANGTAFATVMLNGNSSVLDATGVTIGAEPAITAAAAPTTITVIADAAGRVRIRDACPAGSTQVVSDEPLVTCAFDAVGGSAFRCRGRGLITAQEVTISCN